MQGRTQVQPCTKPVEPHRKNTYFLPVILAKMETVDKWMLIPPSPHPMLFRMARELYTLVFRQRQLWIGGEEGVYFLCLEEIVVWREDITVSAVLSKVVASECKIMQPTFLNLIVDLKKQRIPDITHSLVTVVANGTLRQ